MRWFWGSPRRVSTGVWLKVDSSRLSRWLKLSPSSFKDHRPSSPQGGEGVVPQELQSTCLSVYILLQPTCLFPLLLSITPTYPLLIPRSLSPPSHPPLEHSMSGVNNSLNHWWSHNFTHLFPFWRTFEQHVWFWGIYFLSAFPSVNKKQYLL